MQSLVIFSCLISASMAVTPFFESPDNHQASAFYKKPAGQYAPAAPAPVPVYKPAPVPAYKPEPYKPAYKPETYGQAPAYKPEPYRPAPVPAYKPEPYGQAPAYKPSGYKTDYGNGATSYQNVKLEVGEPSYKPAYKPQY